MTIADPKAELDALAAELDDLRAEHEDLKLLYEATIEHGEAVEDQLAESNLALQKTQRRLEAELEDAARYVMSILPAPRTFTPRTDWLLVPSTELGGDSFGYHEIDDDHLALYLLDVCGHGVGAALLSVTVINVLRASALRADFRDPSSVLTALNGAFPMEEQNDMFFTIWYGVYRRSTGTLAYATGGHPPAIHITARGGARAQAELLATPGALAIGAIEGAAYRAAEARMAPGDVLLLLSDGTFEIDGVGSDMLSVESLAEFAVDESDPEKIYRWVRSRGDSGPLPDDFSLLRLRF